MFSLRRLGLLLSVVAVMPLFAAGLEPSSGPRSGGTSVKVHGTFEPGWYEVDFGGMLSPPAQAVSDSELVVLTPPHFADVVDVTIVRESTRTPTGEKFHYTGDAPVASFERLLVPVLLPPIEGAFGSEFRSYLRTSTRHDRTVPVFGLAPYCYYFECLENDPKLPVLVQPGVVGNVTPNGTPGRFAYVPPELVGSLVLSLRVAETGRSTENYGTELPIVRASDFVADTLVFHDVPTHPRFRNTLRVYSAQPLTAWIDIPGEPSIALQLTKNTPDDPFEPAYGIFTAFPVNRGTLRVTVTPDTLRAPSPPIFLGSIWGFVSVTNNDTQTITTITPQP